MEVGEIERPIVGPGERSTWTREFYSSEVTDSRFLEEGVACDDSVVQRSVFIRYASVPPHGSAHLSTEVKGALIDSRGSGAAPRSRRCRHTALQLSPISCVCGPMQEAPRSRAGSLV